MADGTLKVVIHGIIRGQVNKILENKDVFACMIDIITDQPVILEGNKDILGLIKSCVESFSKLAEFNKKISLDILASLTKVKSPYDITNIITIFLSSSVTKKQDVLQENDLAKKLYKTLELIKLDLEIGKTEVKINRSIQEKLSKTQKDFYLTEQLKQIKKELGQDEENEVEEIKKKIAKLKLH